jgi:hypothetical protein
MCLKFLELGNHPHPRTLCLSASAMEFGNGIVCLEGYWVVYCSMIMFIHRCFVPRFLSFMGSLGSDWNFGY